MLAVRSWLLASISSLLVLTACKRGTSFDENLHEAKVSRRVLETSPAISIAVPPELTEESATKMRVTLVGEPKSKDGDLWAKVQIVLATDADDPPPSKSAAVAKFKSSAEEIITSFDDENAVGVIWTEGGYQTKVYASVWRKLEDAAVACAASATYGGSKSPDAKTLEKHGFFLREICESIQSE